ncbi:MAG: hypothetical protein HY840_11195 [Bacteroidetes bacterium]|nr:hypothetical protein [Bacteroidota bacterium]
MKILNPLFRKKFSAQTREQVRFRAERRTVRAERHKIWRTSVSIYAHSVRTPQEIEKISAEREKIWNERVRTIL